MGFWGLLGSPDGNQIVTVSRDQTVRIWNSKSGELIYNFKRSSKITTYRAASCISPDLNTSAVFSPDGSWCAIVGYKEVSLWDVRNGQLLYSLEGHSAEINSVMFSSNGNSLITASKDDIARIWDLKSGQLLMKLQEKLGVNYAILSPDGNYVITIDVRARVWDVKNGKLIYTLEHQTESVSFAIFSPDGKRIVTVSWDGTAKIWDVKSGKLLLTLGGQTSKVYDAKFSPDGNFIVSAHGDKTARIWDIQNGKLLYSLKGHRNEVYYSVFSPDQSYIVTYDGNAKLWESRTFELIQTTERYSIFYIPPMVFQPDGVFILLPTRDSVYQIWNLKNGKLQLTLDEQLRGTTFATMSTDCKTVATVSNHNILRLWDGNSGKLLHILEDKIDGFAKVIFSPDGSHLITIPELFKSKTAKVWETHTGSLLLTLRGHSDHVTYGKFSSDGNRIITSALDKTVRIWNAQTGELLQSLKINSEFFRSSIYWYIR